MKDPLYNHLKTTVTYFSFFLYTMNKTTTFLSIAAIAAIAGIALSTGLNTSASEVDTTATAAQTQ